MHDRLQIPAAYPNGIASSSPGLIDSIYPGFRWQMSPNPRGVASAGRIAGRRSQRPVENRRYTSPSLLDEGGAETRGPVALTFQSA